MKRIKSQSGFSLVELMVVVAIIGILAAVAIPRVSKFIATSRQSEAQTNLASIYTFNENFVVEYQGFSSDFGALGYAPQGTLRYNTGFAAAVIPANYTNMGKVGSGNANTLLVCPISNLATAAASANGCNTLAGATGVAPPTIAATAVVNNAVTPGTFIASSSARLVNNATTVNDVWSINQDKILQNTADGTL